MTNLVQFLRESAVKMMDLVDSVRARGQMDGWSLLPEKVSSQMSMKVTF